MKPAQTNLAALFALAAAACMRSPEPAAHASRASSASSAVAAAQQAAPATAPSERAPQPAPAEHTNERKPSAGARIAMSVAPTQSDTTTVTVTVTAEREIRGAKLRVGTELPVRVEGEAEWPIDALAPGATLVRTITVRRTQPARYGTLFTATVVIDRGSDRVSDVEGAWVFGDPDPYRVLPQTSATLGESGTGVLGPNDRVVRTPEGQRIHESIVP